MNVLMKQHGYAVETASHKEEAFLKLEDFRPSIVLLDVLLSGTDGREICKEIKSNPNTSEIQVMMISAHPGAAENIQSYGADDFISKPVNTELLLEKLARLVKAK